MNEKGFTLIDMSVLLAVLGLLIAAGLQGYQVWKVEQARGATKANMSAVMKAITDHYYTHDHYPCPADVTKTVTDADYGEEDCSGAGDVMVGAVPFKNIKLPEVMTLDGWSRKLLYAVTRSQADQATFVATGGKIVIDGFNVDGIAGNYTNTGHFLIISLGDTGAGAYSRNGTLVAACPGGTREAENCDGDEIFFAPYKARSSNDNADFYDDFMYYQTQVPSRMWNKSPLSDDDIFTEATKIGIGNPDPQYNIDVGEDIRATNVHALELCDTNGNNCFPPRLIGGSGMRCSYTASNPGQRPLTGIKTKSPICSAGYTSSVGASTCPQGELMVGFDATGNLKCAPVNAP